MSTITIDNWIQTLDGNQLFPHQPDSSLISIEEIATVLARTARFGGHTKLFYSVAQHSVLVSEECPAFALAGLLHDAHEAYSGFGDVLSPMKKLCPQISAIERGLDAAIGKAFQIDPELFRCDAVKHADLKMLATEARDLMGPPPAPWITLPWPSPRRIIPWSEAAATKLFLERWELCRP